MIKAKSLGFLLIILGAVDLSGLKFIQFKTDLIAAQVLYHSHSIKKASNNA